MLKLFLGIFRRFLSIYKNIFNMFFCPSFWPRLWLTGQVIRPHQRPVDRAVDRRAQPCARLADTRAGRSTGPESLALCIWAVDRGGRSDQRACSLYLGGRPDFPNGHIFDRWRSTGRSTASLSGCQISLTASFLFGLYKPHFFGILAKFLWAKNSLYSWCLKEVFKRV